VPNPLHDHQAAEILRSSADDLIEKAIPLAIQSQGRDKLIDQLHYLAGRLTGLAEALDPESD